MTFKARCWKPRLAVLAIATSLQNGCATVGSDSGGFGACPPIVNYSREFQAHAAENLASLPHGAAVAEMLSDYAVMRDQARACDQKVEPRGAISRKL